MGGEAMSDDNNDKDETIDELVMLVALHELPPDEHAAAEAEIDADPRRRAELVATREVLGRLAAAIAVSPPPELRSRVLDSIAGEDQEQPNEPGDVSQTGDRDPGRRLTVIKGARAGEAVTSMPPEPVRRRLRFLELSAAAAVIALLVGAVAWFALGQSSGDDGSTSVRSSSSRSSIAAVLDDPSAETVTLSGDGGDMRLVFVPDSDEAVIVADGWDDPGDDRSYQLWFLDGADPTPSEAFEPGPDGEIEILVDEFNGGHSGYSVTVEPAGGSPAPTGDVLAMTG